MMMVTRIETFCILGDSSCILVVCSRAMNTMLKAEVMQGNPILQIQLVHFILVYLYTAIIIDSTDIESGLHHPSRELT